MNRSIERLYTGLVNSIVLPVGDRFFGQRMMQRLAFLRQAQWWTPEQLIAYRDESLRQLIQTVYRDVAYTREVMDARGLRPEDIRTAEDLRMLPVMTKQMYRAQSVERLTRPTGQTTFDACSSGSTGAPFCVKEDNYTAGWYRAAFMLALEWLGWTPGQPHVQTGISPTRSRGRWIKDMMLNCHYVSAYDLTDAHLDEVLDYMDSQEIRYLFGYPGSLYYLAERAAERGWTQSLVGAATWGDNLYPHYRQAIESTFKTRVTDTYGIGEGMQIAAQCGHGMTYHIFSTDVIVEFLDDADQPVPVGQSGNVVLTRLHPGPWPLIRYKVGDVAIPGGWRRCPCGRGFEVLESLQGRDTDVIVTPSGNRLIVHFFTGILEYFPEVDTFQVIQDEPGVVRLLVVPAQGYNVGGG
ncbi:MAG: phenylacetate--CoA ligase family protein [Chloroflexi bacterium]|nr:phenylacetate--CoA ligase family protein [Chloroflexota bacterium]